MEITQPMERHWKIINVLLAFSSCVLHQEQEESTQSWLCGYAGNDSRYESKFIGDSLYYYQANADVQNFQSFAKDDLALLFADSSLGFSECFRQVTSHSVEKIDAMALNSESLDIVFYSYRSLKENEKLDLINYINHIFSNADRNRLNCWRLYIIINYTAPLPD